MHPPKSLQTRPLIQSRCAPRMRCKVGKRTRRWAGRGPRGLMLGGGADREGVCPRGAASLGVLVQAAAGAHQGRERRSVWTPSGACRARGSSARGCLEPRPEGKKLWDETRPRGGRQTAGALPCQLRQRRARGVLGAAATHAPLATGGSVRGFFAGKRGWGREACVEESRESVQPRDLPPRDFRNEGVREIRSGGTR